MSIIFFNKPADISGNKRASIAHEVVDGRTTGTWTAHNAPGVRPRTEPVTSIVVHHTAGRGIAKQVFRTLRTRRNKAGKLLNLGIHFVVDPKGLITQMADLADVVQHAGSFNARSVGIEVVNPGNACPGWQSYTDRVRGKNRLMSRFTEAQVRAVYALLNDLSAILGLPTAFPTDASGVVLRDLLDADTLAQWRGSLGHIHVDANRKKWDPVPHIMQDVQDLWSKP